ncbi:hypothetical protein [Bradyrhizobium sp.]|uniref:hypothetical protein n=1 Tax=Bradyrhizobium sp. TaxID=376 RepID=UPI003D0E0B73
MISSVRIVPVPLDFFRRNENVFSSFSALGVDVAVRVFYFGRIAVRTIATASRRMVGHMPRRIEFLMQRHILQWMVPRGVIFCVLCMGWHRQHVAKAAAQESFA